MIRNHLVKTVSWYFYSLIKVEIPRDFWVQNTHFKPLHVCFFQITFLTCNKPILVGPGSDSPELKTTKEEYLWHVYRSVVFHWCSIKISLNTQLQKVNINIFWLSIGEMLTRFEYVTYIALMQILMVKNLRRICARSRNNLFNIKENLTWSDVFLFKISCVRHSKCHVVSP